MTAPAFAPGDLVKARGREWIVVAGGDALRLRPLSGSEQDIEAILPALERDPVGYATFPAPTGARPGPREAALLLRDALRLSLRRGAGPFRGAGRIAFEPRAYQLAPLLMALRQDVVRLLIADDVGIGKTIEAGLILRELIDRGDIERFAVLCPPHLVDQWVGELKAKFSIDATAVTAGDAARLERDLPVATSVFEAYPYTVVSLDFIKGERRFNDFLRACPEMVVVDEAHTAVSGGRGKHLRFDLLKKLAAVPDRGLLMLTATPHSGDEQAFHNLIGLLDPRFAGLIDADETSRRALREQLAAHFIQRRRADIEAWREPGLFPEHEASEVKYRLTGAYEAFFREVLDYCADVVSAVEGDRKQRLAFWGTLALMRCVGSSPAAAARALRTRALLEAGEDEIEAISARARDDEDEALDDIEPGGAIEDHRLQRLVDQANQLAADPDRDPKIEALLRTLKPLLKDGFAPVVFCRFIATAEAVGAALRTTFPKYTVEVVTGGDLAVEDREARVNALGEAERRILVATDCLSEGINLQDFFDAVIHYDLSWNPTRHQQREGRVDRFGQKSPTVRTVLLYGENNPVDGAVLEVILRKAAAIEKQTGVRVPLPDEGGSLTKALMSAVLLRANKSRQLSLDFKSGEIKEAKDLDFAWSKASETEKKARTIFAQHSLKPEDVIPEWDATRAALGGFDDTKRFVSRAMMRLGMPLEDVSGGYRALIAKVDNELLRERFEAEGLLHDEADQAPLKIAFESRPKAGFVSVHRAHPLPGVLAESFLEAALVEPANDGGLPNDPAILPRCGVWETPGITTVTTLLLLRIRHRLEGRDRRKRLHTSMAEEAAAVAFSGGRASAQGDAAFKLLEADSSDVADRVRATRLTKAIEDLPVLKPALDAYAVERAAALAEDHTRVRQALGSRAVVKVDAVTPVDVIGVYVLLPRD